MVVLHVKSSDESLFLFECTTSSVMRDVLDELRLIYNSQKSAHKAAAALEEKAKSSSEQISPDQIDVLLRVAQEAKNLVGKKQLEHNVYLTKQISSQALDIIRGSIQTLPDHLREEFNQRIISNSVDQKELLSSDDFEVWFAGKAMAPEKKLSDYVGRNEKSKVIVKIQRKGLGVPPREPPVDEEQQKLLMMRAFQRQEELRRLEEDGDDSYLNAEWADGASLRRAFQGVENIRWKPT